jgi:plastocyanin
LFRKTLKLVPFVVLPSLMLLAAACSSSNNKSNAAPANNAAAPANPVSSSGQSSPATGAGGAQAIAETMTDNKFSATTFTVKANQPVTITAANTGTAIHNWALIGQKDASGKDIKTSLLEAGKSESVTFTITKPGQYKFQCDVHPAEMVGTLTVQ